MSHVPWWYPIWSAAFILLSPSHLFFNFTSYFSLIILLWYLRVRCLQISPDYTSRNARATHRTYVQYMLHIHQQSCIFTISNIRCELCWLFLFSVYVALSSLFRRYSCISLYLKTPHWWLQFYIRNLGANVDNLGSLSTCNKKVEDRKLLAKTTVSNYNRSTVLYVMFQSRANIQSWWTLLSLEPELCQCYVSKVNLIILCVCDVENMTD